MDFYQKILGFIHGWEAEHDNQPPTWLQLHLSDEKEGFGKAFEYKGRSIPIVYSDIVLAGQVLCGQGRSPESK